MRNELTASDPEPAPGTCVRDACGVEWVRFDAGYWVRSDHLDGDPESWVKIAGNYGPVQVLWPPRTRYLT